jgi:hypothetical protein
MKISEEITLKVSPQVAEAYHKATEREKQSLVTLVSLFLGQDEEIDFLGKLMNDISDKAVSRGLTPEILEEILNEELP